MGQFGWQNIVFSIPDNWNLGKVEGDTRKGYLRIDDSYMPRMELRWDTSKKEPDITKIVNSYVERLKKTKTDQKLLIKRKVNLGRIQHLYKYEFLVWERELRAYSFIRYCYKCKRIIFVVTFSKLYEHIEDMVKKIYSSIKDHSEDDTSVWGVYDLVFRVPAAFCLKNYMFKSGHIQLRFINHKNDSLQIDRLSLADTILKKEKIGDWYKNFFKKDLKSYNHILHYNDNQDHHMVHIEGKEKLRLFPRIKLAKLKYLDGKIWHSCTDNKIYAVLSLTDRNDNTLVDFVKERLSCYGVKK